METSCHFRVFDELSPFLHIFSQQSTRPLSTAEYMCITDSKFSRLDANSNIQSGRGRTALFEAVLRVKEISSPEDLKKSVDIINALLDLAYPGNEVDVNVPNPKLSNRTALIMAIYHGHADMALPLIQHSKINLNQQDSGGYTALSLAAQVGLTKIVERLLESDEILVDTADHSVNQTALMLAAERNHQEVVELLLRRGAKPNLKNSNGATAILLAVAEGCLDVVEEMINPQWEVNLFSLDEDNRTLLHAAAENGNLKILEILHEKGLQTNARDSIGMTPLHAACKCGKLEAAQYLLSIGADSSIKDTYGRTPFVVAFQYGHTELMNLCKNEGTNKVADSAQSTQPGDLPVWSLVIMRRLNLLTEAISKGAALEVKEPGTKSTLLHLAIRENANDSNESLDRFEILQQLLTAGKMSTNVRDKYGHTPLHIAALEDFLRAAEILLEHKAKLEELEELDRFGRTPLMIASKFENSDVALALIEAGAKIDESKVDIDKLLLAAIGFRNIKAMEKLLRARADRLAQDDYGRTTDLIARQVGGDELLKILQGARSFVYPISKAKTSVEVTEVEVFDEEHMKQIRIIPFRSPALDREVEPMMCT
jgi:ankyrin repeat protein